MAESLVDQLNYQEWHLVAVVPPGLSGLAPAIRRASPPAGSYRRSAARTSSKLSPLQSCKQLCKAGRSIDPEGRSESKEELAPKERQKTQTKYPNSIDKTPFCRPSGTDVLESNKPAGKPASRGLSPLGGWIKLRAVAAPRLDQAPSYQPSASATNLARLDSQ
ncbi:MAG: hypothetical protein AAF664_03250 [Planctomycetota bacterium]